MSDNLDKALAELLEKATNGVDDAVTFISG